MMQDMEYLDGTPRESASDALHRLVMRVSKIDTVRRAELVATEAREVVDEIYEFMDTRMLLLGPSIH